MHLLKIAPELLLACLASAQSFEVATLKLSPPPKGNDINININIGTARNGRVTLTNATLGDCLKFAFELVSDAQLSGLDCISSGAIRFDIDGRSSADTSRDQLLLM